MVGLVLHYIWHDWFYGVTVSTLDSESNDRGSNPRRTFLSEIVCYVSDYSRVVCNAVVSGENVLHFWRLFCVKCGGFVVFVIDVPIYVTRKTAVLQYANGFFQ